MAVAPLTPAEQDELILLKLRLAGIDISVLNPTGGQDPNDGTPSQESVLASLRATLQSTVMVLNRTELDPEAYSPVMYPAPQFAVRDEPVGI